MKIKEDNRPKARSEYKQDEFAYNSAEQKVIISSERSSQKPKEVESSQKKNCYTWI